MSLLISPHVINNCAWKCPAKPAKTEDVGRQLVMTSSHDLSQTVFVIAVQNVHKLFHACLLSCFTHATHACKWACRKQPSAVKSNTVGPLVLCHDGLWLPQLSRREAHSFGKWHAPESKKAWKSGCFSYRGGTRLRPTEKLCTVPGCSRSSASDCHWFT